MFKNIVSKLDGVLPLGVSGVNSHIAGPKHIYLKLIVSSGRITVVELKI